ncbi:MAG: serine/threonine protein kinase [Planctomycetes bacterium]|nr:serine/threonine protein kinase [Planctomycetota bacterium]
MNDDDAISSADSRPAAHSEASVSHVLSAESTPSTTEPHQSDLTVVSTAPPMAIESPAAKLSPRELGVALEGQQLDHVLLEQFVGGGGMGAVFRAWDTTLHRTVAVKVLSLRQSADVDSLRRFHTEARSAARLDHPNIARAHFVGEDRGVRYIVFEFIEGTNIRDLVHANGPLPLGDALSYTIQIAGALTHAWEREVVHRDIKPSNILITPDGQAKLVDMGLARIEYIGQTAQDETATGVTLGTFDYISPEQARNPRDADIRSDIYSLGCTLFFMLTGRPPFIEGTAVQKLLAHQSDAVPDVREFRPDVPDILATVLARMLAKRPEDRFDTPLDLTAALAGCLDGIGMAPPPAILPAFAPWKTWAPRRTWWRRHMPWLVPAALLLAAVTGLAIKWHFDAATPPAFPDELQIPASSSSGTAADGPGEDNSSRENGRAASG